MKNINLPQNVVSLSKGTFKHCKALNTIYLPASVESVGDLCFEDCENLNRIDISRENPYFSSDAYGIVYNKDKTELLYCPKGLNEAYVVIPDGVTTIKENAFRDNQNIKYYYIPSSLSVIEEDAFIFTGIGVSLIIPGEMPEVGEDSKYWTNIKLYGYAGSSVETYAKEHNLTFALIGTQPLIYSINYNLDGGTVAIANPTTYTIETKSFKLNNPTKDGYRFLGWTGSNGNTPKLQVTITIGSTGDKTYTANWENNTNGDYEIEHYKENLSGTYELVTADTETLSADIGATVTATAKTYEGFTYDSSADGTVTSGTVTENGSLVLKLYYKRNRYTIAYDSNGGTGEMSSQTVKYGEEVTLNKNTFTKVGHEFKGWATADMTSYADEATVSNLSAENNATVTLYARWDAERYLINYVLNNGTNNPENPESYVYGVGLTLKAPTRVGCEFKGWYENSDFTGDAITNISNTKTGDITLYARWEAVPGIDIKTSPTKLTYIKGEELDLTGGVILVTNLDTTTEEIEIKPEYISGYDKTKLGEQTITVTYNGYTDTFKVLVTNDVTGISLKTAPSKLTYIKGEDLSLADGEITVTYQNGETEEIEIKPEYISGYDKTKVGEQTITVTYQRFTANFTVTVTNNLTNVVIGSAPRKTTYIKDEELNLEGGYLTATYQNGETANIEMTVEMISGYDKTKLGEQIISVNYDRFENTFVVTVTNEVTDVVMGSAPSKTTYIKGEDINLAGGYLIATYENGETANIEMKAEYISGYDKTKVGEQTITVNYGEYTFNFKVTVTNEVTDVVMGSAPSKTTYIKGEDLSLAGGYLTATYQNGETSRIEMTAEMISGYDKTKLGEQTITVNYGEYTFSFKVTVTNEVTNIVMGSAPSKITYIKGEDLSLAGGYLTATYQNGETANIEMKAEYISGYDKTQLGEQTITVNYGEYTFNFKITVTNYVTGIAIKTAPAKTTYIKGEELDLSSGIITATRQNGETEDIEMKAEMISGYDKTKLGEQTITVTYEGFTANFKVTVTNDVTGIVIKTEPSKTLYNKGEDLNLAGGYITATFQDKSTLDISMQDESVSKSGYRKYTLGKQTVTIEYEGKIATFEVIVEGIEIESLPSKTTYIKGEELNLDGGMLRVSHDDGIIGEIQMLPPEVTVTGYDKTKTGRQELTVTFGEYTVTFNVVVTNYVTGIVINSEPEKLTYIKGENLELTGGVFTATYQDKTKKEIDMKPDYIKGYDKTKVAEQVLTVEYEGKTATFKVNVTNYITSVVVGSNPEKLKYIKGENLSLVGGYLIATRQNGETEEIPMTEGTVKVSEYKPNTLGEQTITVEYEGFTANFTVKVTNDITGIEIKTAPSKTTYIKGQDLDLTGGVMIATYEDTTTEEIEMKPEHINGYDKTKLGEQVITVTYKGKTAEFTVEVTNDVTGIEIKSQPTKTTYAKGEEINLNGGYLTITYQDKTTEDISMTSQAVNITGYNKDSLGEQTITAKYSGFTANFNVIVEGMEIKTKPKKTSYIRGEELDLTGGVLRVGYKDGRVEEVAMTKEEVNIAKYDKTNVGTQTVTVEYKGYTVTFDVHLRNNVTGIQVKTKPNKTTYIKGEELDLTGGLLTVTYEDKSTEYVSMNTNEVIATRYDKTKLGKQNIMLEYKGSFALLEVTVTNDVVGLGISKVPEKTTYIQGENLALDGGLIQVQYQDGSYTDISMTSNDVKVTGYEKDKIGEQTITLEYEGNSVEFKIKVEKKVIYIEEITMQDRIKVAKEQKIKLKVNIIPENASNQNLKWRSSNSNIVTVDEYGNIEAKECGVAYIIVKSEDGGKTTSCRVEVIESTYEIELLGDQLCVNNINPNTTMDIFKERFLSVYDVEIYNRDGKKIEEGEKIGTGYTLKLYNGEELKEENIQLIVKGDVTGDGESNYQDSANIIYHRLEKAKLEGVYEKAADLNKDGRVNGIDSTILIYHRLKMPEYEWIN